MSGYPTSGCTIVFCSGKSTVVDSVHLSLVGNAAGTGDGFGSGLYRFL